MALIAENVIEEWLSRQGFFTIRGIKLGVHEIDILAMKVGDQGLDLRHYEVQVSIKPIGHICDLSKVLQKKYGYPKNSAKPRPQELMSEAVNEWIKKKFSMPKKGELRSRLAKGNWKFHFVAHNVAFEEELNLIGKSQVSVVRFHDVLESLKSEKEPLCRAAGDDLVKLLLINCE